jgi:hypothetical protein
MIVSPPPALPSTLMPLPSRSTSADLPVVLDTAMLPCFPLPLAAKETKSDCLCRDGYAPPGFTVGFRSCSPTCPSCLDPGLPIHITWHFEIFSGSSSGMISTTCPRFSRKVPHESEPFSRAIDYEAGKPFRNSFKIDDKTGTLFQDNPL